MKYLAGKHSRYIMPAGPRHRLVGPWRATDQTPGHLLPDVIEVTFDCRRPLGFCPKHITTWRD